MVSKETDDAAQKVDLEEIREFYYEVYYSEASASGTSRIPRHYFRLFKRLKISRGANAAGLVAKGRLFFLCPVD